MAKLETQNGEAEVVQASPTKTFFVDMLTRDIELKDAILDLLDNCIDGVVRQLTPAKRKGKKPYTGFSAKITLNESEFIIEDNCGGIPREIAINSAFMLGRPDPERDAELETVGMYGIGMKRAIFKMGYNCVVTTQPKNEEAFQVSISKKWMTTDGDWNLPLESVRKKAINGTKIHITQLRREIKSQFKSTKADFEDELRKEISHLFAIIIEKGFVVKVNGKDVKPVDLTIMAPKEIEKSGGIAPYVFVGEYKGVSVEVVAGFYRPLATEQEIDEELTRKRTRGNAGWTVVCNDRVVLSNDTSMKTGWGTYGVASYHNQFIAISGVVSFRSNNSMDLPLNTTKRGLNTGSIVYLVALDHMKEGLKKLISFTNAWKKREEETEPQFEKLVPIKPSEVAKRVKNYTASRKHKNLGNGKYFSPELPKPASKNTTKRISFAAEQADISILGDYFFEDKNADRNTIGKRCFDEYVLEAKEELE